MEKSDSWFHMQYYGFRVKWHSVKSVGITTHHSKTN